MLIIKINILIMESKDKKETILHFIYINDENVKLNKFFDSVNLDVAQIHYDFKESNDLKINIELDDNCIYYNEFLTFYTKESDKVYLDYPIYKNKINNIYVDKEPCNIQNDSDSNLIISLEIIYQTIKNDLLPERIYYGNKELVLFDTFKNKLRKRIGLVNINPKKLSFIDEIYNQYPDFEFRSEMSYQILARIPLEGNIQYSIASCEFNVTKNCLKQKNKCNYDLIFDKNESLDRLLSFKNDLFTFFSENLKKKEKKEAFEKIKDIDKKYSYLNQVKSYYDNILNYSNFEEIDIDIFSLIFYYLEFLEIKEIKNNVEKNDNLMIILFSLPRLNKNYDKYISEVKKFNINIKDILLLIKTYNKVFIDSLKSSNKINYITTIIIEKEVLTNPYIKAMKFIKDIIINLKEESRLFEIFLYLDSDVIENLLINRDEYSEQLKDSFGNNKQIKYGKNPTEYGTNMANIDEVRSHLFKLLPKYIIRIDTEIKFNANYNQNSKIMLLNEKKLFKLDSEDFTETFEKDELNEKYILPIIIEILHELFGHGKKRLMGNGDKSPEEYRDSKHNYKRCQVRKKIDDFKIINYPESGIVLENYISENRNIMRWLKMTHDKNEGKKLMDISLWIDEDFKKLEDLVINFMTSGNNENGKNSIFDTFINSSDEDFIEPDDDSCGFHKYE